MSATATASATGGYVEAVLRSWPKMLVYGLIDLATETVLLPSAYSALGPNARYVASGVSFAAKQNVPANFDFGFLSMLYK